MSPLPNDEDMSGASDNSVRLANSLKEAVSSFTRPDSVAREVSGDSFVEHFDGTREHEIRLWEEGVSDWYVASWWITRACSLLFLFFTCLHRKTGLGLTAYV